MRKTTEQKMRFGLNAVSALLPADDFYEVSYCKVESNRKFLFYYDGLLQVNMSYHNPYIPKQARVIPLLKKYMKIENKNIDLVGDYINLLIRDCNAIQYSNSILAIGDIQTICNVGQISSTTAMNYRSLNKLIPKFKMAVMHGTVTIPVAVDLAKLGDLSQLEIYKDFQKEGIELMYQKVNYRLLFIAVNSKLLELSNELKLNSAI